ncbi:MAG: hypothetical protein AAF770_00970 [Bacteroidota bacterium]
MLPYLFGVNIQEKFSIVYTTRKQAKANVALYLPKGTTIKHIRKQLEEERLDDLSSALYRTSNLYGKGYTLSIVADDANEETIENAPTYDNPNQEVKLVGQIIHLKPYIIKIKVGKKKVELDDLQPSDNIKKLTEKLIEKKIISKIKENSLIYILQQEKDKLGYIPIDHTIAEAFEKAGVDTKNQIELAFSKAIKLNQQSINVPPDIQTVKGLKRYLLQQANQGCDSYQELKGKSVTVKKKSGLNFETAQDDDLIKEGDSLKYETTNINKSYHFEIQLGKTGKVFTIKDLDLRYATVGDLYKPIIQALKNLNQDEKKKIRRPLESFQVNEYKIIIHKYGIFCMDGSSSKYKKLEDHMTLEKAGVKNGTDPLHLFIPYVLTAIIDTKTGSTYKVTYLLSSPKKTINNFLSGISLLYRIKKILNDAPSFDIKDKGILNSDYTIKEDVKEINLTLFSFKVEITKKDGEKQVVENFNLHANQPVADLAQYLEGKTGVKVPVITLGEQAIKLKGETTLKDAGIEHGKIYTFEEIPFDFSITLPGVEGAISNVENKLELDGESTVEDLYKKVEEQWKLFKGDEAPLPDAIFLGDKKIQHGTDNEKNTKLTKVGIKNNSNLYVFEPWNLEIRQPDANLKTINIDQAGMTFQKLQNKNKEIKGKFVLADQQYNIVQPDVVLDTVVTGKSKEIFLYKPNVFYFTYQPEGANKQRYIIGELNQIDTVKALTEKITAKVSKLKNKGLLITLPGEKRTAEAFNNTFDQSIKNILYTADKNHQPFQVSIYELFIELYQAGKTTEQKIDTLQPYQTLADLFEALQLEGQATNQGVIIPSKVYEKKLFATTTLAQVEQAIKKKKWFIFPIYTIQIEDQRSQKKGNAQVYVQNPISTFQNLRSLIQENKYGPYIIKHENKFVDITNLLPDSLLKNGGKIILEDPLTLSIQWNTNGKEQKLTIKDLSPANTIEQLIKKIEQQQSTLKGQLAQARLSFQLGDQTTLINTKKFKKSLKEVGITKEVKNIKLMFNPVAYRYQDEAGNEQRVGSLPLPKKGKIHLLHNPFTLSFTWIENDQNKQKDIPYITEKTEWNYVLTQLKKENQLREPKLVFVWEEGNHQKKDDLKSAGSKTIQELKLPKEKPIRILRNPFKVTCKWKEDDNNPHQVIIPDIDEYTELDYLLKHLHAKSDYLKNQSLVFFWNKEGANKQFTSQNPTLKLKELAINKDVDLKVARNSFTLEVVWKEGKVKKSEFITGLRSKNSLGSLLTKIKAADPYLKGEDLTLSWTGKNKKNNQISLTDQNKTLEELGIQPNTKLTIAKNLLIFTLEWEYGESKQSIATQLAGFSGQSKLNDVTQFLSRQLEIDSQNLSKLVYTWGNGEKAKQSEKSRETLTSLGIDVEVTSVQVTIEKARRGSNILIIIGSICLLACIVAAVAMPQKIKKLFDSLKHKIKQRNKRMSRNKAKNPTI